MQGILAMICAVAMFALMDTAMKLLSAHYPPMQVAALRGLSSLPLVAVYVLWRGKAASLWRVRWPLHVLRGILGILMLWLFVVGIQKLPLTDAYTLFFISPLLITVLSVVILKERVKPSRLVAVGLGMMGVLVVLRPSGMAFLQMGSLAVLGAAVCYAVTAITVRLLSRTDSSESMVFWLTVMLSIGGGLFAMSGWVPVRLTDWPLVAGLAITGLIGQIFITEAFRRGDASSVAPFEYTALAWAVGYDWLLWRSLPDQFTLAGAAIIICSGIYLIQREKVHAEAEHP